jgi:hypothetical protein
MPNQARYYGNTKGPMCLSNVKLGQLKVLVESFKGMEKVQKNLEPCLRFPIRKLKNYINK